MSENNKIEELEKKLDETRKILDELIYHFMLRFGDESEYRYGVVRNAKKQMLKDLRRPEYGNEEIIFGKDYYEKLGLGEFVMGSGKAQEKLDEIIDEMTEEECEIKLKKVFKAKFESDTSFELLRGYDQLVKSQVDHDDDDTIHLRILDEKIKELEEDNDEYIAYFTTSINISSEFLWSIFEKIKKKRELKLEPFKKEFIRPYKEKYDELEKKIEEHRKTDKLAKIREKEAELERLKKGLS